jgi:hypothetical protein
VALRSHAVGFKRSFEHCTRQAIPSISLFIPLGIGAQNSA